MNSAPSPTAAPIQRCDILIIGAGPAGMAAALAAAPSGGAIMLVDDNPAPGGQIWRDGPGAHLPPLAQWTKLPHRPWSSTTPRSFMPSTATR